MIIDLTQFLYRRILRNMARRRELFDRMEAIPAAFREPLRLALNTDLQQRLRDESRLGRFEAQARKRRGA